MKTMRQKGFTLTEMLVVISIIGIAAAMTFAIGAGFLKANKISQAVRITKAALLEARSRAVATRMNTSVVIYRHDNYAVITNHKWEPLGQPIIIPEPCYYYIHTEAKAGGADNIAPGGSNTIAPEHYIMTITFEASGAAVKNITRSYNNPESRSGAIFITIIDSTMSFSARGGQVVADTGEALILSSSTGAFPSKGYAVVGNELVSFNSVASTGGKAQLNGIQRNLFGSGNRDSLEGQYVYPSGWTGTIMVICATGLVAAVLL